MIKIFRLLLLVVLAWEGRLDLMSVEYWSVIFNHDYSFGKLLVRFFIYVEFG